jgi:nucleoside-diphosphate-sugar epimerase
MTVAIIGAAGFVGTRLQRRFLNKDISSKLFDKKTNFSSKLIYMDVTDINSMQELVDCECIINLAAEHRDDVYPISRYDETNVKGAVNVCKVANKNGIKKIIFTSSVAIYGFATADTDESGEPNFFNDYGRTKYLAEQVYKDWHAEDPENRTLIIVRPTVIFGEGNRGNVYNLLNQVASRKFVMFGNGKNEKSMAYVENLAAFLEYSLGFSAGLHIYNYIDKPDYEMNTLISQTRNILFKKNNVGMRLPAFLGRLIGYFSDFISRLTGKNLPISSIRVKKFMATTKFASSLSKTGFVPPVMLEEGLARTLRYEFLEDNSDKRIFETE